MNYNAVVSVTIAAVGTEPLSLDDAKNWCRVDISDDDALITSLITAARIMCEQYVGLLFTQRQVTAILQNGLGDIDLPYGPVSGDAVYSDMDGNTLTDYKICTPMCERIKAVYTGGYSALPGNLRTALLNQVAWMYENRGDAKIASGMSEPAKLILNQLRP